MQKLIMAKYGEIALKGSNKRFFEDILIKNSHAALKNYGKFTSAKHQSTVYFTPVGEIDDFNFNGAVEALTKVFGFGAIQPCAVFPKDIDVLLKDGLEYVKNELEKTIVLDGKKTFKIISKRADKKFPLTSPEIACEFGGAVLSAFPNLEVDVNNPDISIYAEVRDKGIYVCANKIEGARGMPVGSSGKGLLLLSGGIDSPVAAYMSAKRGLKLEAVHFQSPPYTSERALLKVKTLCEKLSVYTGEINLHIIELTDFQENLRDECEKLRADGYFTVLLRREMIRRANEIAKVTKSQCLITGESLAQVASQTIEAIGCTDNAAEVPVLRPLIGLDKSEITDIANQIDTFETSILPYEDCCTIFTPRHPKIKPKLENILKIENQILSKADSSDKIS